MQVLKTALQTALTEINKIEAGETDLSISEAMKLGQVTSNVRTVAAHALRVIDLILAARTAAETSNPLETDIIDDFED